MPAMRRDALESKITTAASPQGSAMNDPTLADPVQRIRALSLWRGAVAPERLEGGLSNHNFLVRDGAESYVVRLVGGDDFCHGIVRDREVAVSRAAHSAGIAPELVLAEAGLLVLRFVPGRALGEDDLRSPAMLARVAELLRSCHRDVAAHLRGPAPCFWVFHALRDYLAQLDVQGSLAGRTERLRRIVTRLERAVGPTRLALTHNDLMQDKARIVIIGGGAIGCSIAYHLAKSGERDVVVVEKAALCHGSTWHAAGLVGQLRSKRNLTRMLQYSAALYGKLEAET